MEKLHIDDNAIIELVSATHNPDGTDFDINVALSVAETILNFETATDGEAMEGKLKELGLNYKNVPLKIRQLCLEITSGHDISEERIWILNSFYSAASLEMLWIPIVDDHVAWTNEQFEKVVLKMRFLSMDDPRKQIAQRFIRFVKENLSSTFHIGKEPVIISLNKQGKIIHSNAMNMMLIWDPRNIEGQSMRIQERDNIIPFIEKEMKERTQGIDDTLMTNIDELISHLAWEVNEKKSTSSMYTSEREITLWQKEKAWSLGLLVGNIDDIIKSWKLKASLTGGTSRLKSSSGSGDDKSSDPQPPVHPSAPPPPHSRQNCCALLLRRRKTLGPPSKRREEKRAPFSSRCLKKMAFTVSD
nr:protein SIEVE ELEMENT OCCLUSION B-like [Ipomoea batatas]